MTKSTFRELTLKVRVESGERHWTVTNENYNFKHCQMLGIGHREVG
jgi:hypothetical protein